MNWHADKTWSDRFISDIQAILGQTFIHVAEVEDDALRNTDLITLQLPNSVRIGCRVRKHFYLQDYSGEFTLRCSRPSGVDTEIDKILAGWGDYLFYGFADAGESRLAAWFVGDLAVFRRWLDWHVKLFGDWPGTLRSNQDDSSRFMVFRRDDIFSEFIIAKSDNL